MPPNNEQTWEKRFDLALAQAAPVTMTGSYKDADFSVIKSFIRTLLASERQRTVERLREAVRKSHIGITFADGHKIYKAAIQAVESESSKLLADE